MANFKPENVKRFVEDISKKVAENAYNGGGSYSGAVVIPGNAVCREALALDEGDYAIDYAKLADKLAELGFDIDSPALREDEGEISIKLGTLTNSASTVFIIGVDFVNRHTKYDCLVTKAAGDNDPIEAMSFPIEGQSLREVLTELSTVEYHLNKYNQVMSKLFTNEVTIIRYSINDIEYKTIGNIQEFMKDILVPYGSGSSGSSE